MKVELERLRSILIWGGAVLASGSLLAAGLQAVYGLLASFPASGSVGLSAVWIAGFGVGVVSSLAGSAITASEHEPQPQAVKPTKRTARAA
jgi:hypothetical protein